MKRQLLLTKIFILLVLSSFHLSTLYGQKLPEITFEKFILPNGLQVILHEDHSVPMVSVNIWYHVGSKDEKRGRTGFAHLFEHLMFEGSENVPEGMFDKWLEAAGGDNNGSTSEDRTNYWENVPSNALELALYLESDRMANLLAAIDQEKLDTQRDVVKNERRQGVENQPYGRAYEVGLEALYPYNHPYSWPVIGSMEDLSAASLEDVKDFFRRYYDEGFGKLWEQEHKQLVYSDAEKIAKELEKLDFSITKYMEEFTGRKFDNSSKIILYPSSFSRPQHAYGFTENGVKVFLYKVDRGIVSVIASGFHELLHSLIDGWEKPVRIKKCIKKLAKEELFEKTCQELKKSYGYPVGPLEEQLVHSIARYMLYKKGYIDEKQARRGTYGPYEDALYDVLFDKYDSFDNVDDFIYYALSNIKIAGEGKEARFEYIKP